MAGCVPATVFFQKTASTQLPVMASSLGHADVSLDDRIRDVESNLITWALKASDGNKSKAATLLKVKRSTLGDRIKKLGLGHLESVVPATTPAAAQSTIPPRGRRPLVRRGS
jgi:DNA-binding NtrC family response regulator